MLPSGQIRASSCSHSSQAAAAAWARVPLGAAVGQPCARLTRAAVAAGVLLVVSETHAAYAPSTSCGNTSYPVP